MNNNIPQIWFLDKNPYVAAYLMCDHDHKNALIELSEILNDYAEKRPESKCKNPMLTKWIKQRPANIMWAVGYAKALSKSKENIKYIDAINYMVESIDQMKLLIKSELRKAFVEPDLTLPVSRPPVTIPAVMNWLNDPKNKEFKNKNICFAYQDIYRHTKLGCHNNLYPEWNLYKEPGYRSAVSTVIPMNIVPNSAGLYKHDYTYHIVMSMHRKLKNVDEKNLLVKNLEKFNPTMYTLWCMPQLKSIDFFSHINKCYDKNYYARPVIAEIK